MCVQSQFVRKLHVRIYSGLLYIQLVFSAGVGSMYIHVHVCMYDLGLKKLFAQIPLKNL